jgi:hypothetical protein
MDRIKLMPAGGHDSAAAMMVVMQPQVHLDAGVISSVSVGPVVPTEPSAARTTVQSCPQCQGTTIRRSGRHAIVCIQTARPPRMKT